jgi:hypothetical protein
MSSEPSIATREAPAAVGCFISGTPISIEPSVEERFNERASELVHSRLDRPVLVNEMQAAETL